MRIDGQDVDAGEGGPRRELPSFAKVLVVVAHPDDEAFGLGAVISALLQQGTGVDLLCFSRGEASSLGRQRAGLAALRERELQGASALLGIGHVELLSYPDGGLDAHPRAELAAVVCESVRDHEALVVFDEGGITGHPDHRAATAAALDAAASRGVPALAWVVPSDVAVRLNAELGCGFVGSDSEEIDIRFEVDRSRQRAAIALHASQSEVNPVVWRRLELTGDVEYLRFLFSPDPGSRPGRPVQGAHT